MSVFRLFDTDMGVCMDTRPRSTYNTFAVWQEDSDVEETFTCQHNTFGSGYRLKSDHFLG